MDIIRMTDSQFSEFIRQLQTAVRMVDGLKKIYKLQTGRDFVDGQSEPNEAA